MDLTFETVYEKSHEVFADHTIDLKHVGWFDPWTMGLICLKGVEFKDNADKRIVLPQDKKMLAYLKRMHFDHFFGELTYASFLSALKLLEINERDNDGLCEIVHCEFRDAFEARLASKVRRVFRHFGLGELDEALATSLVGELGNNVFDHNDGSWPTSVRGAIILAQHNPALRRIEVAVADPGIGFRGSLRAHDPTVSSDVEAIKLGLSGVTGRIGETRGNGLQVIQNWTINKFDGIIRIQSGNGLVIVDGKGQQSKEVFPITGTLASLVLIYK